MKDKIISLDLQVQIDALYSEQEWGKIGDLEGIEIATEYRYLYAMTLIHIDCVRFAAIVKERPVEHILEYPTYYKEVAYPQPGDLVLYFNDNKFTHVGIYEGQGIVLSKWNGGFVYRHNLITILSAYGKPRYFRSKSEKEINLSLKSALHQKPKQISFINRVKAWLSLH